MEEVIEHLRPSEGALILDGTVGGGGHSQAILEAGANVIGLDRDPEALAEAERVLAPYGDRFAGFLLNFRQFGEVLAGAGVNSVDGILLDLGVSSHQLDVPGRGFSFRADGPLDMRMGAVSGPTAAEWIAETPEEEMADAFFQHGNERASRRIARAIVRVREDCPIRTTMDLAAIVEAAVGRHGKRHPATRVFQALRMVVNDELGALESALADVRGWLRPGGRLAVITFHSGEDRIVKQFIRHASSPEIDRPEWPEPRPNPDYFLKPVLRGALAPTAEERARNPRSRSAKLRVAECLKNNA